MQYADFLADPPGPSGTGLDVNEYENERKKYP